MFGLFGNPNDKIIKKYHPIVNKINALEDDLIKLSDEELREKTFYFKKELKEGKTLIDILPESFAVVREASKRVLGQRHFDVQLMGGITLHNSMIAEMLTGEGKTLVSTLPAYLNALEEKGVHIITVNDYLAKRDSEWMGEIFKFLGLSVGVIVSGSSEEERKKAYNCDITYGTNNEFGFDYLRDNMKVELDHIIQRPFHYAIIDEIDSVLIDEARTPLIISGATNDNTNIYKLANGFVKFFNKEDFVIEEKDKTIQITEVGLEKCEKILKSSGLVKSGSLFDANNIQLYHFINQSLKAHHLFKKEVDYIVKDNQVFIIDEFTGRVMEGRRFSDGLHQALEAKENIRIREENQTLASVTYQNYFKMYPKLSGMTGTAKTEEKEFIEIYGLKVVSIPSNKEVKRIDKNDEIYLTIKDKEKAIIKKVKECYERGQPVLIGTVSIEKSEKLSKLLKQAGIKHNVLNAKHHDKEAYIISQAGTSKAVTIATNMAGRGTDIQLGGNADMIIEQQDFTKLSEEAKESKIQEIKEQVNKDKERIIALGGLCVVGTERHESRRIDNQLRGRSGRQGETGISIFYISMEDDLMRIFGSNKLEGTLKRLGFKDDESISHPMISKSIEKAQKRVEEQNFEIRKTLLKFDNVINEQRTLIYSQRKEILAREADVIDMLYNNIEESVEKILDIHLPEDKYQEQWQYESLQVDLARVFNINQLNIQKVVEEEGLSRQDIEERIILESKKNIDKKIQDISQEDFKEILTRLTIQLIDYSWKQNLLELDYIRGSINLRAYANKDPFNEYQKESFILFTNMLEELKERIVTVVSHLKYQVEGEAEDKKDNAIDFSKVGRNDSCPCNSGKKYKHCHGR